MAIGIPEFQIHKENHILFTQLMKTNSLKYINTLIFFDKIVLLAPVQI